MRFIILVILIVISVTCHAQLNPQVINIPMRDGKTLTADLHLPSTTGTYPVIFIQTPYNKNFFRIALPLGVGFDIANSPYAFVVMDWRCFYASAAACALDASRGEDGYDAVEWIASQSWSDGKVGTWGPSALGNVQFNTAREQPPHLVCSVPIVSSPQFSYEQYYPGGVALPEYLETLGSLFGDAFALVKQNPYYNLVWQITEASTFYPSEITIPMLHIGGWFDHNTESVLKWFHAMRDVSPAADTQWMLMGPWTHGGAGISGVGTAMQGELSFPEAAGFQNTYARAFYDYYLRDIENGCEATAPVTYFQMGDHIWQESTTFPPTSASQVQSFYLRNDMSLSTDSSGSQQSISYRYDPLDPSPTVGGKTLSDELDQGPYDQAAVEARNDNLLFTTGVLTDDLSVEGQITVHLFVSSDRPDTDIHLRLTEVYPDGRSIAFGQIVRRMRFRNGFRKDDEAMMMAGEAYEVVLKFDHLAHTFKAGSRIRLIISSSNHIWFNRNMNTGDEMYPNGNLDTLVAPVIATNSIHLQGQFPARMIIPNSGTATSIFSPSQFSKLSMVPNPAIEYIELKDVGVGSMVQVFNPAGQELIAITTTEVSQRISLKGLRTGIYIVVVKDRQTQSSSKGAASRLFVLKND
jgi:predicted acyl esterase